MFKVLYFCFIGNKEIVFNYGWGYMLNNALYQGY